MTWIEAHQITGDLIISFNIEDEELLQEAEDGGTFHEFALDCLRDIVRGLSIGYSDWEVIIND